MANPIKLIISSKKKLADKYGKNFQAILDLVSKLVASDKLRGHDTRLVFIDDAASAKKAGIKPVPYISEKFCKNAVDELYRVILPSYIVLLGADDVFPFQTLENSAKDSDKHVPSDLPYACDAPYSKKVKDFMGPTRTVGRIPDVPGQNDISYLNTLITNIINFKPLSKKDYQNYFSITAVAWENSSRQNMDAIFGNHDNMLKSPPAKGHYTKEQLQPLTHFFNLHGSKYIPKYYGQKDEDYPEALHSPTLNGKITRGALVAAECCYGAQLYNPMTFTHETLSIAHTYLLNNAISFLGSSTIAYGEANGLSNADLMTQYYVKNVLNGFSAGRALLEARHKFINANGPHIDPYEKKTMAQFYILGDPSLCLVAEKKGNEEEKTSLNTVKNRRMTLYLKGKNLEATTLTAVKIRKPKVMKHSGELKKVLKTTKFTGKEEQAFYAIRPKAAGRSAFEKKMMGGDVTYRTFTTHDVIDKRPRIKVLIVKEDKDECLGWKVYISK